MSDASDSGTAPPVPSEADAQRHLEELADRIAAAADVLDDCREARDRAIIAYVDAGIPQKRVARWAKCDPATVTRALAKGPELEARR